MEAVDALIGVTVMGNVLTITENPSGVSGESLNVFLFTLALGIRRLCGLSACGLSACEYVCGSPLLEIRKDHLHLA